MKFCSNCGRQLAEQDNFCQNCGAEVVVPVQNSGAGYQQVAQYHQPQQNASEIYRFVETFENNKFRSGIVQSFETLEQTGAIRYLDEIYTGQYVLVDKAYFSEHLIYIPHRFILAYKDIANVTECSGFNEFKFEMVDGKTYSICMLKITQQELSKHVRDELKSKVIRMPWYTPLVGYAVALLSPFWIIFLLFGGLFSLLFRKKPKDDVREDAK